MNKTELGDLGKTVKGKIEALPPGLVRTRFQKARAMIEATLRATKPGDGPCAICCAQINAQVELAGDAAHRAKHPGTKKKTVAKKKPAAKKKSAGKKKR